MPGGSDFRKWYAMRAAMKAKGKWHGKKPTHSVPEQEEGEPEPKRPATETDAAEATTAGPSTGEGAVPSSSSTPDSLPPLEEPPTAEGKYVRLCCSN